jgi:ferredoxin/nitrate reductase gamma subunit
MTHRADPHFLSELQKYGSVTVESCFNCGNCTAVCPLSSDGDNFPRRMIRYAQLGMRDRLLSSRELWMCYFCGECSETCPRQAEPGEFMATLRRYAIASYDRLGLAKMLVTSPVLSILFMLALGVVLAGFMVTVHGPMPSDALRLFEFIPAGVIHNLGLAVILVVFLTGLLGAATMVLQIGKANGFPKGIRLNWLGALWEAIGVEVLGQRRYRQDCAATSAQPAWYLRKWFIHASTMWGFLGLLAATALDYALELLGVKPTGTWVPIWYPVRLLGTVAGLFLVYGASVAILKRLRQADEASKHSSLSDWALLVLLWLSGISGFVLEIALYLPQAPAWGYWMLLFHVAVAMELVLLAPFTKFAHAFYRTVALYMYALKPLPETMPAGAGSAE